MEDVSYYMDQQLKQYKAAITDAYKQFQLDEESRIAAAHAVIDSYINSYKHGFGVGYIEYLRAVITGMLSMAAACHLLSFEEIAEYKKAAEIERIEVPFKMTF